MGKIDNLSSLPRILATMEDAACESRPFTLKISCALESRTLSFVCLPPDLVTDCENYVNRLVPLARRWFASRLPQEAPHFTVLGLIGKDNLSRLATGKAVLKLQDYKTLLNCVTTAEKAFDKEKNRLEKEPQFDVRERRGLVAEKAPRKPRVRQPPPPSRKPGLRPVEAESAGGNNSASNSNNNNVAGNYSSPFLLGFACLLRDSL